MMEDRLVTYKTACLAKEKGFPHIAMMYYEWDGFLETLTLRPAVDYLTARYPEPFTAAPTQSLLQRWLREEKGVVFGISPMQEMDCEDLGWCATIYKVDENGYGLSWKEELYYNTYELVLENALKYALENLV